MTADQFPPEMYVFRNYESPDVIMDRKDAFEEEDHYVWYVCRSSGAAPTYFTSIDKYLDGGLIS